MVRIIGHKRTQFKILILKGQTARSVSVLVLNCDIF